MLHEHKKKRKKKVQLEQLFSNSILFVYNKISIYLSISIHLSTYSTELNECQEIRGQQYMDSRQGSN